MMDDSMLREVKVEDAVGLVLAHDLTQILPGRFKGRLFRKGHVIREEDIPALLSIGKEHIYTIHLKEGFLHEDEAAERMARAVGGNHIFYSEPHEGKVTLKSEIFGLAKIAREFIDQANAIDQVAMATIRSDTPVKPQHPLAGMRVIPLIVDEPRIARLEKLAAEWRGAHPGRNIIEVKPFRKLRAGLITTGSEVFKGRIEDRFGPVVREKLAQFGSGVIEQRLVPDDSDTIVSEIRRFLELKADLILVTGGMSVDPDDRTPGAIRRSGAEVVSYGTPMLPGSMLMTAYLGEVPILGLPGCVMHDPYTSFDVILPRICAGERITREDITAMGYGGLYGY